MSPPTLPASKLLNAFIKDKIAPALLGAGFNATGRVYRRVVGEALQVIDLQNWKYNDPKRARFTMEIGVCFPRLLAAVAALEAYAFYRENVGKPGITECVVRRRLGELMQPPQDLWWTVSATTAHVPPPEEVTAPLMNTALPWLDAMSTIAAVASAWHDGHALTNRVMTVAALFAHGQATAASDAATALAKARYPGQPELEQGLLHQLRSLEELGSSLPG